MNPVIFDHALILTGPTASGKTAVGLALAERLGAEIVSMDSMTLYRGMDIGTAKPSPEERARVPHHLLDVLDPWESSSLAWWLRRAAECCRQIEERGKRALFIGGTPLYLKGVLRGIFEGPPASAELRLRLEGQPGSELHERLSRADPAAAARIHPNDLRRLVRALEVLELTGRPISEWQQQFDQARVRPTGAVWLDWPREELYARINRRVDHMIEQGLFDEVRNLAALASPLSKEARQALGYKELLDYLCWSPAFRREHRLKPGLQPIVERIKTRSRNFAKRQLTWFRHLPECRPVGVCGAEPLATTVAKVLAGWNL